MADENNIHGHTESEPTGASCSARSGRDCGNGTPTGVGHATLHSTRCQPQSAVVCLHHARNKYNCR